MLRFAQHDIFYFFRSPLLIEFLEGSDLLILDSQYNDAEYLKRVSWGHGCVDDAVAMGMFARVRQLCLFHHDPDHDDAQVTAMLAWARELVAMHGDAMRVDAATEGVQFPISAGVSALA